VTARSPVSSPALSLATAWTHMPAASYSAARSHRIECYPARGCACLVASLARLLGPRDASSLAEGRPPQRRAMAIARWALRGAMARERHQGTHPGMTYSGGECGCYSTAGKRLWHVTTENACQGCPRASLDYTLCRPSCSCSSPCAALPSCSSRRSCWLAAAVMHRCSGRKSCFWCLGFRALALARRCSLPARAFGRALAIGTGTRALGVGSGL